MPSTRRASSVPAVEDALVARLQARLTGTDTVVVLGLPDKVPQALDRLYVLGVQDNVREHYVDQGARRETYVLPLLIECYYPSRDERQRVRDRFWTLVEEVEAELADDPELADVAGDAEVEQIVEMNVLPSGDGWLARGLLHIRVLAVV